MKFIVGLTGGIGSGKSTVAGLFREKGIVVVDADIAARKVVEIGTPALSAIAAHFGVTALQADGTMDRAAVRKMVFDDPDKRQWLEHLLHPAIAAWIANELASATSPYAILESPLLLETSQYEMVDHTLVVDVDEQTQIDRASTRDNNSPEQIKAIIAAQLPRESRLNRADSVIDNDGSLQTVHEQVNKLHETFLRLATNKTREILS